MHFSGVLALAAALLPLAAADLSFTSPTSKSSFSGGDTITVEWEAGDGDPDLKSLDTLNIKYCVGSNADPMCAATDAASVKFTTSATSTSVTIPAAAGDDGDVYFLKFELTGTTANGYYWVYTDRFSMTDMTGTFSTAQKAAQKKGDTTAPDSVNQVLAANKAAAGTADAAAGAGVTYTKQTGATRYAPMQSQPGTTITAKSASRQFPTSSYKIFTTYAAPPTIDTTVTAPWTYTMKSKINSASAAPMPDDSMQKYLARWRD